MAYLIDRRDSMAQVLFALMYLSDSISITEYKDDFGYHGSNYENHALS